MCDFPLLVLAPKKMQTELQTAQTLIRLLQKNSLIWVYKVFPDLFVWMFKIHDGTEQQKVMNKIKFY